MEINSKILVTGGRGLVGSAIRDHLEELGYSNVVVAGRQECDFSELDDTVKFFEKIKPDYVFHCAAKVYGIMGNIKNQALSFFDNIRINTNVIHASHLTNVRKVTAMGTGAVYPYPSPGIPLREEMIFMGSPHGAERSYANAKKAMISMFDAYQDSYGLDWAYVVSCNLFGARDKFDTEFGHVVPSLIKKFHDVKMGHSDRVVVWGDGSAQRDFMYVKDTARVCVEVMTHLEGTVNIGSGRVYSIRDIVDKLGGIFDLHGSIDWDETKPNGQDFRSYELSKINSIGFRCKYSIDAGLEETVEWYASQQNSI